MLFSKLRRVALRSVTLVLACLPMVQAYVARAQERPLAVAEIPFGFSTGRVQLPAGRYRISQVSDSIIRLTGESTSLVGTLMVYRSDKQVSGDTGKLVFHNYDGHLFLASVLLKDGVANFDVVKSRAEKDAIHVAADQRLSDKRAAAPIQIALK